jgi:hypothetical protein
MVLLGKISMILTLTYCFELTTEIMTTISIIQKTPIEYFCY